MKRTWHQFAPAVLVQKIIDGAVAGGVPDCLLVGRLEIMDVQHLAGAGSLCKTAEQGLFLGQGHILVLASTVWFGLESLDAALVIGHVPPVDRTQRHAHRCGNRRLPNACNSPSTPECGKLRRRGAGCAGADLQTRMTSLMDSTPMQPRVTEPRSAWAWLSFVVGLALTIPLIWRAWTIIGPNTYMGGDGKIWQSLIREIREFAPAFHVNVLNPLQGVAGYGSPINIWADPVYWPFLSDDRLFATQGSTLVAYVAVATAIFILSRIWRVPLGASIAGSLSSFIVFPSFSYIFGFSALLSIVPDAAMGAALMIITAGLSYWVNDLQWRTIVSGTLLLALWLGYTVYSNPSWFIGAGFVFAPLIAFCILDARSTGVIAARVAAFAIAFALLYAVGPVDYVRTLFAYSARIYFYSEWSRPQDVLYASWVFESPRLLWTYLFFLSGWVAGADLR